MSGFPRRKNVMFCLLVVDTNVRRWQQQPLATRPTRGVALERGARAQAEHVKIYIIFIYILFRSYLA